MNSRQTARIRLIAVSFFLVGVLLSLRLFQVQVIQGDAYTQEAEEQYTGTEDIYDRGTVYFLEKDGTRVSAATLASGYRVVINPSKIENAESVYSALASIIDLSRDDFFKVIEKKDDPYEIVARKIGNGTAKKIKELSISGVFLEREQWRYYPGEEMAAHALGFVGFKEDDFSGRYGVERYYEDVLTRNEGTTFSNFFAQVFSGIGDLIADTKNEREGDLVLTIEPRVQAHVEEVLERLSKSHSPQASGAIIIHPETGKIYAMGATPSFSPNTYYETEDIAFFANPLVENVYEMGSIVKPLTLAAALDADAITETDTYVDRGTVVVEDAVIANYDGEARGRVPMQEILNQSLNTGAVHVMQELGKETFRDYMLSYGLGDRTHIDLPDEVNGLVDNLYSRREIEYATASFGQGIATTPIAMVRALSALANGGYLVRPHIVSRFEYDGLPSRDVFVEEQGKVLQAQTSRRISTMLTRVVDDALLGGRVALPQYSIAAKTGTAQIPNPDGEYYDDRFLHSFFGYFPAYDPQFLVFLYIVDPEVGRYASETLTEPFMDITKFLLSYYEVIPDR